MSQALDPRLQRLLDKDEIRDVLMKYCRGVDRCDREMIAECYHPDSADDHGNFIIDGKDAAELFTSLIGSDPRGGMHFVGNCLIEVENDTTAFAESYFMAIKDMDKDGKRLFRVRAGRYIDRFERRDGRWRIAERVVADEWNRITDMKETVGGPEVFRFGAKDRTDLVYAIRKGNVARARRDDLNEIKGRQRR